MLKSFQKMNKTTVKMCIRLWRPLQNVFSHRPAAHKYTHISSACFLQREFALLLHMQMKDLASSDSSYLLLSEKKTERSMMLLFMCQI